MFSSFFQDTDLSQRFLKTKMKKFIARLGESFPEWAMDGLCSGYVFMLMRAELSGESPKFFSRLTSLSTATDSEITEMTKLIKRFNTKQMQLINSTFSELKNEIKSFEDELKQIQKQIIELESKEKIEGVKNSATMAKFNDAKIALNKKISEKRKIFFDNIEKQVKKSFSEEEREWLEQGQELYYFIHSLLAAFNPKEHLNLRNIKDESVQQRDFVEILSLLPSDNISKNLDEKVPITNKFPVRHAFSFQFGFTDKELAYVLNKSLLENDLVRFNSINHAMYLKKQNNKLIFYDPNNKTGTIEFSSADEAAKKIIQCVYDEEKSQCHLIGIDIFEKNTESPPSRPSIKTLLNDLFKGRNQDKNNNSINEVGAKSYTVLHMAAKAGNNELIQELVQEWKADPSMRNDEGMSPVSIAANRGHEQSVTIMTDAVIAKHGKSGLEQIGCIERQERKPVQLTTLDDKSQNPIQKTKLRSPLELAAKKGYLNIVKFLINRGADVNLENYAGLTPINSAIINGHTTVLKTLMEHKGLANKQNSESKTPLYFAVYKNQSECIKLLAHYQADLDQPINQSATAALLAANEGYDIVIKTLADLKADLNKTNSSQSSPLHLAANKGHDDVVKLLIERKVNLDEPNNQGYTPLMLAALNGHAAIIKQLTATQSIKLYLESDKNLTALLLASQKGHIDVIKELITARADINKPNIKGITPVCMAVKYSRLETIRQLAESKANLDRATSFGASPISLAIEQSNPDIFEILAENKADLNKKLKDGRTPVQAAMEKIESGIVNVLAKYDANFDFIKTNPEIPVKFLFTVKSSAYITKNPHLQKKLQPYADQLTAATIQYIDKITEKSEQAAALEELKSQQNALGVVLQTSGTLDKVLAHFIKPTETITPSSPTINIRI